MKILLDNNVTKEMKRGLAGHIVSTAVEEGWEELSNGELLRAAELGDFKVMITADKNMIYQQNNQTRSIALVVLDTNRWRHIRSKMNLVHDALERVHAGGYERVTLLDQTA